MQVLRAARANTVDKILEVASAFMFGWARLLVSTQPGSVGVRIFIAHGEVTLRTVKDVANGIVPTRERPESWLAWPAPCFGRPHFRSANFRLMVGDPMPDFKLEHFG